MPGFPLCNKTIREDERGVGRYQFLRRYDTDLGQVLLAKTAQDLPVAVKIVNKSEIGTPDELESLYREFRFVKTLDHPHIVKCVDAIQTSNHLYIVMDYAGDQNLEQYCTNKEGQRLDKELAYSCFAQILSALAKIHSRGIAHRSVSHHHVAVRRLRQQEGHSLHCTLVDFRDAVLSKDDQTLSQKVCGWLPYIPPEMVSPGGYIPSCADAWSVGVLLLEIAGGLGSLAASAYNDVDEDSPDCASHVIKFFNSPSCHEVALGKLAGVNCQRILRFLKKLLLTPPRSRASLPDLASSLNHQA